MSKRCSSGVHDSITSLHHVHNQLHPGNEYYKLQCSQSKGELPTLIIITCITILITLSTETPIPNEAMKTAGNFCMDQI